MATPIFDASPGSKWRDHVTETWRYLHQNYKVTANPKCGTHVHISLAPNYELRDIRRIAASVLYFEPAFEALVPKARRRNRYVKSNWMDSPWLARKNISRAESIAQIERASSEYRIMILAQGYGDKNYGWNLWSVKIKGSIEFRKPQASLTADEALSWAELAINFIQAAIEHGTSEQLNKVPATIGGLRWFLEQVSVPGVNEPSRLQAIWAGKNPKAMVEPRHIPFGDKIEDTFREKARADERQIRKLSETTRKPYW
jgi:Putative amidoligase enzyme